MANDSRDPADATMNGSMCLPKWLRRQNMASFAKLLTLWKRHRFKLAGQASWKDLTEQYGIQSLRLWLTGGSPVMSSIVQKLLNWRSIGPRIVWIALAAPSLSERAITSLPN